MQLPSLLPFQDFFENYAEAILITRSDDTPVFINRAFCRLTGYEAGNLILLNPEYLFKESTSISFASERQEGVQWETEIIMKDGNSEWVKVSVSPVSLSDGFAGKVYTIQHLSTIEQLKSLLKESETRFVALADASPVMIWMTDRDNLCYYFNKTWLDFTGKKLEDELGNGWTKGVHPDDMKAFTEVKSLLRERKKYSCEYRLKRHDNTYGYILEIGTPRFLPDGNFAGYMGSCLDISPMKEAQLKLDRQAKELLRSNEELEQFAYVASHDMQEPLRMIGSYVQLLEKNMETGNLVHADEFMKYITQGVNRMQLLINDLLQYSRVNRKSTVFGKVNLGEVIKIVMTHLAVRIEENGAVVMYDDMPEVIGDQSQLIRLFQNFIDNAIKFKSPDRKPLIHISVKDYEKNYEFSVSDNGIGIDQKFYNRIFVIFQRLHTRTEYEGTGIGLAVCKKIVERHGGEIRVESGVAKGTTFYFTLKK